MRRNGPGRGRGGEGVTAGEAMTRKEPRGGREGHRFQEYKKQLAA